MSSLHAVIDVSLAGENGEVSEFIQVEDAKRLVLLLVDPLPATEELESSFEVR